MQSEINIHDVLRLLLSVHDPTANKEIISIMQSCDCISLLHSFIEMVSNNTLLTANSNNELHLLINFITRCIRFNLTKNKQVYNNNNKILIHIIKQIYTTCIIVSNDDIALTWLCDVFTFTINKLSKNNTNIEHIATLNQLINEIVSLTDTNVNLQLKLLKAVINSNSINELTLTTIFTVLDSIYERVKCTSLEMYFDTLNRVVKRFHAYDICINKITQRYHQLVLSFISGNNCQQQQPVLMSLNVKATLFHLLCTIITKFNVVGAHNDKYIMLILTEISHIKISLKNNKQQLIQALSTHTNTHYVYLYSFITLLYVLVPGLALTAQDVISLSIEIIVPLIDIALSTYNAVNCCDDNNEIIHYHFINNIYNTCTPVNAVKETKSNLLFTLSSFLKRMLTLYGRYLHQTICYYINTLSHNDNLYLYLLCLLRNTLISTQTTNEIVFPLLSDKLQTNINIQPHTTPLYNNVYFWLFIDNYFIYFYLQFNKDTFHKLLQFVLNSVVNINVHNNQLGIIALANITKNLFSKKNNVNALPLQEAPFLCSEMIKFYNTNITHIINTFVNVHNESAVTVFYTLILKVINKNIIAVGNGDDKCIEKLIYFIINHLSTKVNATITKYSTNKSKQYNDQQLIFTMFNLLKQLIIKNESYVNSNDNNNNNIETIMFTNVFDTLQYVNYISFEHEIIDLMNTFIQCRKRISNINYITKLLPHINQLIRKENEFNKNVFQLLINIIQYITDEQKDIMFNGSISSSSNGSHSNFIYKVYNRVLNSNSNYKETFMIKSFLLKLLTTYNNITEPTITKILTTSFDALLKALTSFNKQNTTLTISSTFNIELYITIHNILYDICIIIYSFFSYAQDVMNAINRNNMFYAFVNAVNMFIENVRNYKWMNVTLGKMIIIGMINVVNRNYYHNDSWMLFNIAYEMMLVVHDIRVTEIKAKEGSVKSLRDGYKENYNDDSNVTGDKGVNVNDDMKIVNEVNAIVDLAKFKSISNVIDEFECFKSCAELLKEKHPNEYNGVFLASMKNNGSIERYNNILHTKKVKIELNTIDINNNDKYIYIPRRIVTFKRNNMNIDIST